MPIVGTAVLEDRHAEGGRAVEEGHADAPGADIAVDGLALGGDESLGVRGVGPRSDSWRMTTTR
jgi:hypothetical protein